MSSGIPMSTAENIRSTNTAQTYTNFPQSTDNILTSQNYKTAIVRLKNDLKALMSDTPEGCSASPVNDDLFEWTACIFGPTDTPWEGGIFQLRMQFTHDYPQEPPTVRFTSKMFHPNVFRDGSLCLDIIKSRWSPIYTVTTILTSIQSLLQDPNPDSPADQEAATLFVQNRKAYNKMVRKCVEESI